jgi:hypothetical protein
MAFEIAPPRMTILSDHPSRADATRSPDLLALEGRLASVFDILRHRNTECPVTVAIYGDWGTGKTSAMRWLETQLKEWNKRSIAERDGHPMVHPVWFDPWRYHTREDVWRGIIAEVVLSLFKVKAIRRENFLDNLRRAARRFGAFLGRGFLHALANIEVEAGAGEDGPKTKLSGEVFRDIYDEWDRTTHPEKAFLNQFEDTLKSWLAEFFPCEERQDGSRQFQERLVLFIDDLDRCLPSVTLEVLEAIKLYLNLEPLLFIVGLDRAVVDAVVTKHYKDAGLGEEKARSYLNKLFQVEVQVPAGDDQIKSYRRELLASLDKATGAYWRTRLGDDGTLYRDMLEQCIHRLAAGNPREIKRLINSALVRGHNAASNRLLTVPGQENERFAQGVAFYLLQRQLREHALPETLLMIEENLLWFGKASQEFQPEGSLGSTPAELADELASLRESLKSLGPRDPVRDALQNLLDARPPGLQQPAFVDCLASEVFWSLLLVPFDPSVGLHAPRLETRSLTGPPNRTVDLARLSEPVRARLAKGTKKTLDTLTLADLDSLSQLDLNESNATDLEIRELAKLSTLQEIILAKTRVTDAGLKELARLPNLRRLSLFGTSITDAGLKHLTRLSALEKLSLVETQITDAGLKELARHFSIQALYLSRTQVTDIGLKEIARLPNLEELYLSETQITDGGLEEIARLSKLKILWLGGTKVTDSGTAQLKKTLPNLSIGS